MENSVARYYYQAGAAVTERQIQMQIQMHCGTEPCMLPLPLSPFFQFVYYGEQIYSILLKVVSDGNFNFVLRRRKGEEKE